ncbi:glycogen synthase [Striga asiatica]|uniref:Glycogen synthase n=1 Tax=Striga asiatica TaxID=4170 RepID=A0A5A7PKZ4_STRAF|nr:glycogen synthase [Striga asiatica]
MASTANIPYRKLKYDTSSLDKKHENRYYNTFLEKVIRRSRSSRLGKLRTKRKQRLKIPSLRRFLRRKARVLKFAWKKVCKRLKESQSHFGDLFGGNYLFMQVTPTPLQHANYHVKENQLPNPGFCSIPRIN